MLKYFKSLLNNNKLQVGAEQSGAAIAQFGRY